VTLSVSPGDLIRFNKNKNGDVSGAVTALEYSTILDETTKNTPQVVKLPTNYLHTIFGRTVSTNKGKIKVSTYNADKLKLEPPAFELIESVWDITNAATKYYVFKDGRATVGTAGDIEEGNLVFLQYSNFRSLAVVVYK
jgi:hypothetical protein